MVLIKTKTDTINIILRPVSSVMQKKSVIIDIVSCVRLAGITVGLGKRRLAIYLDKWRISMYTGTLEGLHKWLLMTEAERKKLWKAYEEERRNEEKRRKESYGRN